MVGVFIVQITPWTPLNLILYQQKALRHYYYDFIGLDNIQKLNGQAHTGMYNYNTQAPQVEKQIVNYLQTLFLVINNHLSLLMG